MMRLLKKYRLTIILVLVLSILSFWFIPRQEDLYLQTDFELLKKKSNTFLVWTIVIGAIILLFFAMRGVKNIREVGNVLLGVAALAIPFYFVFEMIFLSGFLALNNINFAEHVDKKYTTTFFLEADNRTPMIYDFSAKKVLLFDNIKNIEALKNLNAGDTVTISFNKGLLGFTFNPTIK